ncbi:glutathione gamma-glutamylcysteinyltransferase 3-like [Camellia sinensis]|nr:glutathione gamma-glutamylcysteinyltransferase 3-like [Camellia sinensis]
MVLTRLPYDPCVLYTLSCRDGSWIRTANHLSQIPLLLESEDVKDVNQILSVLFMSVSTNFSVFIKQVAEAKGKDGHVHSSKRKRKRLTTQCQLLMQLRETELHKRVSKWMDSRNPLLEIAANVSSDGVKHSTLNPGSSGRLSSTDSVGSSKGNYERVSVEMSEPVICSREQGPGKMIQTIDPSPSGCSVNNGHFICKDALTMLLLALPSHMWSGIKEPNLSAEFNSLVSIESVPHILKKEVTVLPFLVSYFL